MASNNINGEKGQGWTPEEILGAVKEGVTALLGVIVVVYTLYLAGLALGYVGDATKSAEAKDILTLMLGLAGVVVGYYFGRVPADARASEAHKGTDAAVAKAEQVSAQAQSAADQLDQIISRMAAPAGEAARGAALEAAPEGVIEEMKRLRETLHQVSTAAR